MSLEELGSGLGVELSCTVEMVVILYVPRKYSMFSGMRSGGKMGSSKATSIELFSDTISMMHG